MKIVTINVPQSYIEAMEILTAENGLYPSRSELIRVAVRKFLIRELKKAQKLMKLNNLDAEDPAEELDEENFVKVPINKNDKNEEVREFKTFKILKKLDTGEEDTTGIRESEVNKEKYMTTQRKAEQEIKTYTPDFEGGFF